MTRHRLQRRGRTARQSDRRSAQRPAQLPPLGDCRRRRDHALKATRLRTNGLITANQVSATTSQVYGKVEAVSISGSTYNGTTTQIIVREAADDARLDHGVQLLSHQRHARSTSTACRRKRPIWAAISASKAARPTGPARPPACPRRDISQSNNQIRSGSYSLRVQNRTAWNAGAAQYIDGFVKPGQQYTIDGYVYLPGICAAEKLPLHAVHQRSRRQRSTGFGAGHVDRSPRRLATDFRHAHRADLERQPGIRVHQNRRRR